MIQRRALSGLQLVLAFSHQLVSVHVNVLDIVTCVKMLALTQLHSFHINIVNCGILMVMAFIKRDDWGDFHGFSVSEENTSFQYTNYSQGALMSLFLTLANIVCVCLGATLMFRMKEVLPVKKKVFWDDLKIARRIFQGRATDDGGEVLTVRTMQMQAMLRPTYSGEEIVIPAQPSSPSND